MAPWPVQTHVLLTSVEGMAPKKAQPAKSAKEAAARVPEGEQPAAAPKEAKPQAPKEAAKQQAAAAPKDAAKQPAAAAAPRVGATPKEVEPQAPEEVAQQPAAAAPVEAAEQPAAATEPKEAKSQAPVGRAKEATPQAPKEAAKEAKPHAPVGGAMEATPQPPKEAAKEAKRHSLKEAAKEAKPQAPKEAAQEAKPPAPVGGAKEATPQAPKEAAKEAKPQATKKTKEKEQWLRPGITIPGWDAASDDSSSGGHSATFSAGEMGELTDVELEAYKTGGPPPTDANEWDIPRDLGIAPVGRSWQNRQWRRTYREQYPTGAANVARGTVEEEGNPVKFHVTTDTTPTAYYYVAGKKTAWEAMGFHWLEEWLRQ